MASAGSQRRIMHCGPDLQREEPAEVNSENIPKSLTASDGHASVSCVMHDLRELRGVVPPMITCFAPDDSVDSAATAREAKFLLDAGVDGVVVGGSTGEGAGMSENDLYTAVSAVVDAVGSRIPVLGGVIADNSH